MDDKKYIDFILGFERECNSLSEDIITRLCKRVIKQLNKKLPDPIGLTDDYPASFNFYDILSIEIQSAYYEEINPYLRNCIEDSLEVEYEKLPDIERFIVDHSECSENLECDHEAIEMKIFNTFHELLNVHYNTKKIQDYIAKL